MIGMNRTYIDVARELSEGLASGTISLDEDETRSDLASLAFLLFRFLSPMKMAYEAAASDVAGTSAEHENLEVEIRPEEYEHLSNDLKTEIEKRMEELRKKGVKIEIRNTEGKSLVFGRSLQVADGGTSTRSRD